MATPRAKLASADPGLAGAWPLVVLMVLAVALVAVLATWDNRRESAAALDDFAEEQATLASSVAAELSTRLASVRRDEADQPSARLLEGAARVERPGSVRVLLAAPGEPRLRATDGGLLDCEPVQRAIAEDRTSAWLVRPEAAALGLPPRRAAAGIARIDAGPFTVGRDGPPTPPEKKDPGSPALPRTVGRWAVVVVSSAERMRDREMRASYRLTLVVLLAAGLVFVFGTAALRRQRRGLLLERELAIAAVARERDAELGTASRAATLGTLAMGIAHEVSTPLGVIAGRAEQLLPRVEGDERASRSVRAILDQSERIRRVIRAFLDVVRGGEPALGDIDPAAVLTGAAGLVDHRFAASGVTLETHAAPALPMIHADVPMLQQALVNLMLNACDACSRGGRVEARVARADGRILFTVTDDGRGITAEEAARAAEPFFTTKAPGLGSGIGLSIANEIVKLHRGRLSLEPASPRGTRASVSLPLPEERADAVA